MTDPELYLADVETTGTGPNDRIVELAYAKLSHENGILVIDEMVRSLIDPEMPIPAGASGVHGITDEMVADAPTLDEFLTLIRPPVESPVIFCAHNAPFDQRFLARVFPNITSTICTLRLSRKVFPEADNHKLDTLRYHLNLYKGNAHRADEDVRTSVDLLNKILAKSGIPLEQLACAAEAPILLSKLPFGKFKGRPLSDICRPGEVRDWVMWLLSDARRQGKALDKDLAYSIDKALKGELA